MIRALAVASLLAVLAAPAWAQDAGAGAAASSEARSLARQSDPVTVRGRDMPPLVGKKIAALGAFAIREGRWTPIPYQIDEKIDADNYVFPAGKENNGRSATGLLKKVDEVVFMARDAGDRSDLAGAPAGAGTGVEVTLTDPVTGAKGWAYVFEFAGEFPKSGVDYVAYEPERERITAETYEIQYTPGLDHIFFSQLSVPEAAGGSGAEFCDRLKLRTYIKTRLFVSLSFDEEEWESNVKQYLDGPVRVIRQVENRLSFLGIDVAPTIQVDATYYRDLHVAPAIINQTLNLPAIAREAWFKASIDFSEKAEGMKYYRPSPGVKDPYHAINGRTESDEEALDPRAPPWHLVTGAPGTLLWWLELPKPLVPVTDLYYVDERTTSDPPEATPGAIGEIGFKFDLFPLAKGKYFMRLFYGFPSRWKPGDEKRMIEVIEKPLKYVTGPALKAG
ncbi:MAG: hypothetical protein K8I02_07445, partial [Candidatus Methylomirabilis sp.]|nr:hypothetical protein [Deltaproteobacteria bacterium]